MKKCSRFSLIATTIYLVSIGSAFATGLPTFDFSNFTQAIESLVKAIDFYNTTIRQTKQYISKIETISKGLSSGDFNMMLNSISGMISIANDTSKNIESIIDYCSKKREEAEIKSKKATLEIIKILTDPSVKGIKEYASKRDFDDLSASEQIKQIAKDAKDAITLLLNDHSDSTKKAMDELDLNLKSLSKKLSETLTNIGKARDENSQSMTALESLSGLSEQYMSLSRTVDQLMELSKSAKGERKDTGHDLKEEEERWQDIIDKIDKGINSTKKLSKSIKNMEKL